ncbi:2-hydroxyacyl-CoA dehydratase [bacterium]|nr:2-hydroxyacyl-CoA dehydratase [bacterium]
MNEYTSKRFIGLTTTIPVEIIYAAGAVAVDLNNVFIAHAEREDFVKKAELDGYPRNVCRWIKGIYGAVLNSDIKEVVAVMQGDCSNTHALAETLNSNGIRIIPFSFPYDGDYNLLKYQLEHLAENVGVVNWFDVIAWKRRLDNVRKLAERIDEMTYRENVVTGFENHLFLVSTSDFEGAPTEFERKLKSFIDEAINRPELPQKVRLAYIGVPPIFGDIYDVLEQYGARVVFNEVQRQFSMPFDTDDIVEQYRLYTYPYDVQRRIDDISEQIKLRRIDGIIHYTEPFCFRQIEDIILRKAFEIPYILIEGGENFSVDERTKMRLQAFVEILKGKKKWSVST